MHDCLNGELDELGLFSFPIAWLTPLNIIKGVSQAIGKGCQDQKGWATQRHAVLAATVATPSAYVSNGRLRSPWKIDPTLSVGRALSSQKLSSIRDRTGLS